MGRIHLCVVTLISIALGVSVSTLSVSTHGIVNGQAAQSTVFQERLRGIGFTKDLASILRGNSGERLSIQGWLEEGGEREDDRFRYLHHFHDPLKPWDTAGLDRGFGRYSSAVRWMQDPDQGSIFGLPHEIGVVLAGGSWSWRDARRLYYQALTEPDPVRREALWADLFRAVGQIMHLVVDASVPEHTRNDMHPLGALKLENSYERWVGSQHSEGDPDREARFVATYLSAPIGFAQEILSLAAPAGESVATVPVARLIDADRYDGSNPSVTVGADPHTPVAAGLAEIANANFFSEDTLQGQYPSPTDAALIPVNLVTSFGRMRRYFSRPAGHGLLPANPLRAECAAEALYLRGQLLQPPPYPCVDAAVWNQVAAHMLPRAVGYARGVLDYFFRGSVRVRNITVNNPVPGFEIPGVTGTWIDIENTFNERMEGVFEVYARHDKGTAQERRTLVSTVNRGAPVALEPGGVGRFRLSLLPGDPTPYQILVFRGRLGSEEDAVVGQVFAVPYVRIVQASYDANITKSCTIRRFSDWRIPLEERLLCSWQPVHHRVEGTLATNFSDSDTADPGELAIEQIRAFWTGNAAGPAPLTIDGIEYQNGVWHRHGTESNPETFVITDPAVRRDSPLWLSVSVRGHPNMFTTQLATFKGIVTESAEKEVFDASEREVRYLWLRQIVRVPLNVNANVHSTVSIGGYPVPTPLTLGETLSAVPYIARDSLQVTSALGVYWVMEVFEVIPYTSDYKARFNAIPLEAPFPEPPGMHWSAEVVPKPLDSLAREFWRAFVASSDPPSEPIVLTGREAEP